MNLAAALCLLAATPGPPHPDSLSSSEVVVVDSDAFVTLRCQALSLAEVIDGLDANGDGEFSAPEIDARADEVYAYVVEHYRVLTGTDRDMEGGLALTPEKLRVSFHAPDSRPGIGARLGSVDVEVRYRAGHPIEDLAVHSTLFSVTSPDHMDVCTVSWSDDLQATFVLSKGAPRGRSDPESKGAFQAFVVQGWGHILSGWDHICFVLALILSARRLRALLWVVTAFTLAHSVTLSLMSLGVVNLHAYSDWIEAAIALSIAYVATDNILHSKKERSRWIEAFLFGLIHGLGFAGFLAQSLVGESSKTIALVGFNVGVEAGQIAIVTAMVLALRLFTRDPEEFLAPRPLRLGGSALIAAFGFYWFFQRV